MGFVQGHGAGRAWWNGSGLAPGGPAAVYLQVRNRGDMPSDVFISYAKPDEARALTIVEMLEAQSSGLLDRRAQHRARHAVGQRGRAGDRRVRRAAGGLLGGREHVRLRRSGDWTRVTRGAGPFCPCARPTWILRGAWSSISARASTLNAFPDELSEYQNEIIRSVRALIGPRPTPAGIAPAAVAAEAVLTTEPTTALVVVGPVATAEGSNVPNEAVVPVPEPPAVREVIGFDLGHGETAVAKAAVDGQAHPMVVALGGKRSQVSAIGFHPQRGFVLGDEAVLDPAVEAVLICFKEPPGRSAMARSNRQRVSRRLLPRAAGRRSHPRRALKATSSSDVRRGGRVRR